MNAFKITLRDGNSFVTSMNATEEEAKAYFSGYKYIEENFETGEEKVSAVAKVEKI